MWSFKLSPSLFPVLSFNKDLFTCAVMHYSLFISCYRLMIWSLLSWFLTVYLTLNVMLQWVNPSIPPSLLCLHACVAQFTMLVHDMLLVPVLCRPGFRERSVLMDWTIEVYCIFSKCGLLTSFWKIVSLTLKEMNKINQCWGLSFSLRCFEGMNKEEWN